MSEPLSEPRPFKDITGLAKVLRAVLVVYLGLILLRIGGDWLEIQALQRIAGGEVLTEEEAAALEARLSLIDRAEALGLTVSAASVLVFLRLTYLANRNARALGAKDLKFTPV